MKFEKAKDEFIQAWGVLGTSWGINRTMAQIFALLMITPGKLSVEEIMEELQISRGNASMNLRALMDWNLIEKIAVKGERKEYFHCISDVWELSRKVAEERKNREVVPILRVLDKVSRIEDNNTEQTQEFIRVTTELKDVVEKTDQALSHFINSDKSWVTRTILSLMKTKK